MLDILVADWVFFYLLGNVFAKKINLLWNWNHKVVGNVLPTLIKSTLALMAAIALIAVVNSGGCWMMINLRD